MKKIIIRKHYLKVLIVFFIMLSACSGRNGDNTGNSKKELHYFYLHEGKKIFNQNPYLTNEYIEERKQENAYVYYPIDTLSISDAIWLIYKSDDLQLDMITSKEIADSINFSDVTPWELLSMENIFLKGLGGENRPIFYEDVQTLELPKPDINRESIEYSDEFVALPLLQEKFLFVIIDEATFLMTEAVEGLNASITAHIVGLPIKMVYPLKED